MSNSKINNKAVQKLVIPSLSTNHVDKFDNFQKAVNRRNRLTGGKCLKSNGILTVPKFNQSKLDANLTTKLGAIYARGKQDGCLDANISKGGNSKGTPLKPRKKKPRKSRKSKGAKSLRLQSLRLQPRQKKSRKSRKSKGTPLKPLKKKSRKSRKNKSRKR